MTTFRSSHNSSPCRAARSCGQSASISARLILRAISAKSRGRSCFAAAAEVERHETARAYFEDNPVAYHQYLVGALDYIGQMIDPSLADRLAAASLGVLGHQDGAHALVRRVREANTDFDVDRLLSLVPSKEQWHRDPYREGSKKRRF